jgi:hypothetical protein
MIGIRLAGNPWPSKGNTGRTASGNVGAFNPFDVGGGF